MNQMSNHFKHMCEFLSKIKNATYIPYKNLPNFSTVDTTVTQHWTKYNIDYSTVCAQLGYTTSCHCALNFDPFS